MTEWMDEKPYPGPTEFVLDLEQLARFAKTVTINFSQAATYVTQQFDAYCKSFLPHDRCADSDKPILPKEKCQPPARSHGPRNGPAFRSDGKRRW